MTLCEPCKSRGIERAAWYQVPRNGKIVMKCGECHKHNVEVLHGAPATPPAGSARAGEKRKEEETTMKRRKIDWAPIDMEGKAGRPVPALAKVFGVAPKVIRNHFRTVGIAPVYLRGPKAGTREMKPPAGETKPLVAEPAAPAKRKPGRPKGSRNYNSPRRGPGRPRKSETALVKARVLDQLTAPLKPIVGYSMPPAAGKVKAIVIQMENVSDETLRAALGQLAAALGASGSVTRDP